MPSSKMIIKNKFMLKSYPGGKLITRNKKKKMAPDEATTDTQQIYK